MNGAIASIFGFLNAVAAIAIIAIGFIGGTIMTTQYPSAPLIGIVLGLLIAALFCGPMALLVAMLGELKRIRKLTQ